MTIFLLFQFTTVHVDSSDVVNQKIISEETILITSRGI